MLQKLGPVGILGAVLVLVGIGTIAIKDPVIALGMGLVVAGLGLLAKAGLDAVMGLFGMV